MVFATVFIIPIEVCHRNRARNQTTKRHSIALSNGRRWTTVLSTLKVIAPSTLRTPPSKIYIITTPVLCSICQKYSFSDSPQEKLPVVEAACTLSLGRIPQIAGCAGIRHGKVAIVLRSSVVVEHGELVLLSGVLVKLLDQSELYASMSVL